MCIHSYDPAFTGNDSRSRKVQVLGITLFSSRDQRGCNPKRCARRQHQIDTFGLAGIPRLYPLALVKDSPITRRCLGEGSRDLTIKERQEHATAIDYVNAPRRKNHRLESSLLYTGRLFPGLPLARISFAPCCFQTGAATTPLRFDMTSPPSDFQRDFTQELSSMLGIQRMSAP
jgi:hypothetical protein